MRLRRLDRTLWEGWGAQTNCWKQAGELDASGCGGHVRVRVPEAGTCHFKWPEGLQL